MTKLSKKNQVSQCDKADVIRCFLLPFNDIIDLEKAFKKIFAFHQMEHEQTVAKLKFNGIPYQILEPYGIVIDMATVPEGVKLKELISYDEELKNKVYQSVGVIKNIV